MHFLLQKILKGTLWINNEITAGKKVSQPSFQHELYSHVDSSLSLLSMLFPNKRLIQMDNITKQTDA